MVASLKGHVDTAEILLEYKAEVNLQNSSGFSSLMLACHASHVDVVKVLVENNADEHIVNIRGGTAFNIAERNNHLEIINLLSPITHEKVQSMESSTRN